LDALSKCNIILRLYNRGFNLDKEMVIGGKKITPLEYFKTLKANQIIDWYEAQLSKVYDGGYDSNLLEDDDIVITDDFIQSLADAKEYGIPYAKAGKCIEGKDMNVFPYLSSLTLGFTKKASHYIAGFSSSGKTSMWSSIVMSMALQEKVLIICNEQDSRTWKMNMLLFILYKHFHYTDVTKNRLMSGSFKKNPKQIEMIQKAKDYFNEHYKGRIHFIQLAENNFDLVKSKVRYFALQLNYGVVIFDTLKIADSNRRSDNLAGWEELVQYSRDLDILAKKLNICMCCSVQLAQNQKGNLFLGSHMLSGAKGIVEQLDTLLCLRDVYKEELDPNSKFFCAPFQKVLNETTGEYEERPYECDPKHAWKMCFLGKSRNSENSDSSGCAIMLKFFGPMAVWSEPCWARPKHAYITDNR
jgi:replicative DNA helicase